MTLSTNATETGVDVSSVTIRLYNSVGPVNSKGKDYIKMLDQNRFTRPLQLTALLG